MKLHHLKLQGQYKGLSEQSFDFHNSQGNILAFIGLNGSGKSQLLELIAETFAYLERVMRADFINTPLGIAVEMVYQLSGATNHSAGNDPMTCGSPTAICGGVTNPKFKVSIDVEGIILAHIWGENEWLEISIDALETPDHIVGYASGLNENLQRSFMKNAVQFYEIARIRLSRHRELNRAVDEAHIADINQRYLSRSSYAFQPLPMGTFKADGTADPNAELVLSEPPTPLPKMFYMDYDSSALLLASFAILADEEINELLKEIKYRLPRKIVLRYDLRTGVAIKDAISDIELLARIGGENAVRGIGRGTTLDQYEDYGLDHLAGFITLDVSNSAVKERLRDAHFNDPVALFQRLYKLQLLGVKNWQGADRQALLKDNFIGTVKKPLKTKLPLAVTKLELSNDEGKCIDFDDLSDGEVQLMQIVAAARIFGQKHTLFIFDEPETHLNPSWRTYFHQHLANALQQPNNQIQTQVLLSSHSPFMISSLKRSDVYCFERNDNKIEMEPASDETYGASFEVLIKQYFNLRSLISQTAVTDIKQHLPDSDDTDPEKRSQARQWIEQHLGDSMEKAYLLGKLQD